MIVATVPTASWGLTGFVYGEFRVNHLRTVGLAVAMTCAGSAMAQSGDPDSGTSVASVETEMEVGPNVGSQPRVPTPKVPETPTTTTPPVTAEAPSRFHAALELDYTTGYYGRGILAEDVGLILQPFADLRLDIFRMSEATISAELGTWNSFHGEATNASSSDSFTKNWYESDLYFGAGITMGHWVVDARYYFYTSPSNAFGTIEEVYFSAAYDDSELLGKWSLKPTAILAVETGSHAADGGRNGTYLQLGISPGFTFDAGPVKDVAISFPASMGLSLSNYYEGTHGENDAFGFASLGAKATVPLNLDKSWGAWSINAGIQVLLLGDAASTLNNGDHTEVIGTFGVAANF